MKGKLPIPGWRNVKTAVAVMVCFVIFLPWWGYSPVSSGGPLDQVGPFYACVASIICMQSSVEASVKQGLSRLLGTLVGGLTGLLAVSVTMNAPNYGITTLVFGLCVMATIYICSLLHQPKACSIAAIVCCAVMLSHSGEERYFYTLIRMAETAVGIVVAVLVNRILPTPKQRSTLERMIEQEVQQELEQRSQTDLEQMEKDLEAELQHKGTSEEEEKKQEWKNTRESKE